MSMVRHLAVVGVLMKGRDCLVYIEILIPRTQTTPKSKGEQTAMNVDSMAHGSMGSTYL